MVVTLNGVLHTVVDVFFKFLIVMIIVRIILRWVQLAPGNPIMRFVSNIADPILNPITRRLPRMSIGMLDVGSTVALIFMLWALFQIDNFILYSMPISW